MSKRLITLRSSPKGYWIGMPASIVGSGLRTAGTGYDELLDINDITGDGFIPNKTFPPSPLLVGNHVKLTYSRGTTGGYTLQTAPVGFPPGVKVSIRKIEVKFVSGHIEVFDIPISAMPWWAPFASPNFIHNSALVGQATSIMLGQPQYHGDCINDNNMSDIDPMTSKPVNPFYSVTADSDKVLWALGISGSWTYPTGTVTAPFATFTKYSGANATTIGGKD